MITITPIYAALLAFLLLILSARVILYRRANRISVGDGDDRALTKRIRIQANCTEYAPIGLLLMLLVELQGNAHFLIHALGLTLLAGRVIHAAAMSRTPQSYPGRTLGMVLTLLSIASAAAITLVAALL
jgi:uncharacterized protein